MTPTAIVKDLHFRYRSMAAALVLVGIASVLSVGAVSPGAAASTSGRISAHLTSTGFTAAQASGVKLVYRFSSRSSRFGYALSRKQGSRWVTVRHVSTRGSFRGSHAMTVKHLFGTKPITVAQYSVKLSAAANSVALRFKVVNPIGRSLVVSTAGTGSGTVTSSPSGIDCPSSCRASFKNGTQVTLTATAASGSTFAGWSGGGCSGTGTCLAMLSSDLSVTATFNTSAVVPKAGSWVGTVSDVPFNARNGLGPGGHFTVLSVFFAVEPGGTTIRPFGFKYSWGETANFTFPPCGATGSGTSTASGPSPITGGRFSASGPWTTVLEGSSASGGFTGSFQGTFSSAATASGTGEASGGATGPTFGCGGAMGSTPTFYWTATWQSP